MALIVDWVSPDPAVLGARLAEHLRLPRPDPDEARFALVLTGGVVRVGSTGPGGRERIVSIEHVAGPRHRFDHPSVSPPAAPSAAGAPSAGVRLLGAAWATVEMERGVRELASKLGVDARAFTAVTDDGWLGAAARVARLGETSLVVLEPVTEGRAAAALARFGEGPVAVYLELPGPAVGIVRPGPVGAAELLGGAPPWGPFILVRARPSATEVRASAPPAGTIDR